MVVSEELLILASCLLRPMSRNSVLEEFSVKRFAVIQEEIRFGAFCHTANVFTMFLLFNVVNVFIFFCNVT